MWDVLSGVAKMAWDVMSGVTKTAWDVMSGVTKTAWDVLSGVANLHGMFCPGWQKMAWDVLSRDVLSGSQCSHAGPFNKKCEYVLMQTYWEMGTYSHSGTVLYLHYHKVSDNCSSPVKVSFKIFIYCNYDQAISHRADFFYIIEAQDILSEEKNREKR